MKRKAEATSQLLFFWLRLLIIIILTFFVYSQIDAAREGIAVLQAQVSMIIENCYNYRLNSKLKKASLCFVVVKRTQTAKELTIFFKHDIVQGETRATADCFYFLFFFFIAL